MLEPFSSLFQAHGAVAGDTMPNVADPESARAVMIVGIIIILGTFAWAVGGLGAAVWVRLNDRREKRFHSRRRGTDNASAR